MLRSETKQSKIQVYFFRFFFASFHFFFAFFRFFFTFFRLIFCFPSIFSINFRLFYLRFRFRFLVFLIEVNHVKSGFFFASKRNKIFASISNFASEAKVRAHPRWCYTGLPPLPATGKTGKYLRRVQVLSRSCKNESNLLLVGITVCLESFLGFSLLKSAKVLLYFGLDCGLLVSSNLLLTSRNPKNNC